MVKTTPIALVEEKVLLGRPVCAAPSRGSRPLEGLTGGRPKKASEEWRSLHELTLELVEHLRAQRDAALQGQKECDEGRGKSDDSGEGPPNDKSRQSEAKTQDEDRDSDDEAGEPHGSGPRSREIASRSAQLRPDLSPVPPLLLAWHGTTRLALDLHAELFTRDPVVLLSSELGQVDRTNADTTREVGNAAARKAV